MKKAIYLAGAAVMMLASCAKERAEQDSVRNESHQEIQGTVVTIQAALGSQEAAGQDTPKQNAATKTTQTGGNYSWSDGETISVGTSEGAYTTFTLSNAATGTFTHTFEGDVPDLQMAVSPVQSSGSYTGTGNFTVSLPTEYNGYVSGTTNALLIGTPDPETENKFLFHHAAALVKVTYNNVPYGTTGLVLEANQNIASTSGITLSSTDDVIESDNAALNSSSVQINLASAVSEPNQSLIFYVPVPVGEYTGLNIYLVNSSGKIDRSEKTSTKAFTLARKEIFATPGIPVDITIDPVTVGTENTGDLGANKSQPFKIYQGKRLNLIFENFSAATSSQPYYNWVVYNDQNNLYVRADKYAKDNTINWGQTSVGNFPASTIYNAADLNGTTVIMTIDYYESGAYILNAVAKKNNTTYDLQFQYTYSTKPEEINIQLYTDHSHFVMKDAWLEDAPVTDSDLSSIAISNGPTTVYVNQYIKDCGLTVTATFADGTTKDVTADATYSPAYYTQTGTYQTVTISYAKTKLGNSGTNQTITFTVQNIVAAPPVSIAVTTAPTVTTYYYTDDGPSSIAFRPGGMVVTSTNSAGGTATVSSSNLSYSTITKTEGAQDVTITYTSGSIVLTTTQSITLVKGTGLGNANYSTAFGTVLSEKEQTVASSSSVYFTFDVYAPDSFSDNWKSPTVVLDTDTDVHLRSDNFGWYGDSTSNSIPDGNKVNPWGNDWASFRNNLNKSRYNVTVTNNGNNTATIIMEVIWASGTIHTQRYNNVTVNSSNLKANITCENNYLVFPPSE